jgi:hypothetical protein
MIGLEARFLEDEYRENSSYPIRRLRKASKNSPSWSGCLIGHPIHAGEILIKNGGERGEEKKGEGKEGKEREKGR